MKTNEETVGIIVGNATNTTKGICRSLTEKGISAIVVQKESPSSEIDDAPRHWSGQPGKDLFFNGWKLLF